MCNKKTATTTHIEIKENKFGKKFNSSGFLFILLYIVLYVTSEKTKTDEQKRNEYKRNKGKC